MESASATNDPKSPDVTKSEGVSEPDAVGEKLPPAPSAATDGGVEENTLDKKQELLEKQPPQTEENAESKERKGLPEHQGDLDGVGEKKSEQQQQIQPLKNGAGGPQTEPQSVSAAESVDTLKKGRVLGIMATKVGHLGQKPKQRLQVTEVGAPVGADDSLRFESREEADKWLLQVLQLVRDERSSKSTSSTFGYNRRKTTQNGTIMVFDALLHRVEDKWVCLLPGMVVGELVLVAMFAEFTADRLVYKLLSLSDSEVAGGLAKSIVRDKGTLNSVEYKAAFENISCSAVDKLPATVGFGFFEMDIAWPDMPSGMPWGHIWDWKQALIRLGKQWFAMHKQSNLQKTKEEEEGEEEEESDESYEPEPQKKIPTPKHALRQRSQRKSTARDPFGAEDDLGEKSSDDEWHTRKDRKKTLQSDEDVNEGDHIDGATGPATKRGKRANPKDAPTKPKRAKLTADDENDQRTVDDEDDSADGSHMTRLKLEDNESKRKHELQMKIVEQMSIIVTGTQKKQAARKRKI